MKTTLTAIALVLGLATQAHAGSDQYWSDHYRLMDLQDQLDELQEDQEQARMDAEDAREEAWFERQTQLYAAPPLAPIIPGTNDPRECSFVADPNYKTPPGFAPLKTPPQCAKGRK